MHVLEIDMPHGLSDGFVAMDTAIVLMEEEENADLEDVWDKDKWADRARFGKIVSEDAVLINEECAQGEQALSTKRDGFVDGFSF